MNVIFEHIDNARDLGGIVGAGGRAIRPHRLLRTAHLHDATDADVKLAFELLNARYNDTAKLTLISTEWSLEGLLDIDEALGSRIYERAKKHWLNFNGRQNWRLRP